LDPDNGKIRWNSRISADPDQYLSALYFGLAAEGRRIFIPSIGLKGPFIGAFAPSTDDGLYARDAFTGTLLWSAKTSDDCPKNMPCAGISTAPIGLPGLIFAGSMDGYVRAYDTRSGRILWHVNTAQQYTTLSGDHANGGAVAGSGIMIANGVLYINSGYFGLPGNVLLAFSADRTHRK
jgi:polyvinyl alcohol dehydrogenase (cytochrome)